MYNLNTEGRRTENIFEEIVTEYIPNLTRYGGTRVPVILATQELHMKRTQFEASPGSLW
jgi:hypothetical protein